MRTKTEILDELWVLTAEHLLDKIKSGKATPSDISNAAKFLKEGITDELKEVKSNSEAREQILCDVELPYDDLHLN